MVWFKDNGGVRSGFDRRIASSSCYPNDRRSGKDRRNGYDRRSSNRPRCGWLPERRLVIKVLGHNGILGT
jgi:hypothetical protein